MPMQLIFLALHWPMVASSDHVLLRKKQILGYGPRLENAHELPLLCISWLSGISVWKHWGDTF